MRRGPHTGEENVRRERERERGRDGGAEKGGSQGSDAREGAGYRLARRGTAWRNEDEGGIGPERKKYVVKPD